MRLHDLGIKHGTDKALHKYLGLSYLDIYENLFGHMRRASSDVTLLEIGVKDGSSLRMWKEWLPGARIIGFDIDPACASVAEDNIEIWIGNQGDYKTWDRVLGRDEFDDSNIYFDVVIDDGSHLTPQTIAAFESLYPQVESDGWYCIEDMDVSHMDVREWSPDWPGMEYNDLPIEERGVQRERFTRLFETHIKVMDMFERPPHDWDGPRYSQTQSLQFYPKLVAFQKA